VPLVHSLPNSSRCSDRRSGQLTALEQVYGFGPSFMDDSPLPMDENLSSPATGCCRWGESSGSPATGCCRWGESSGSPATGCCRWGESMTAVGRPPVCDSSGTTALEPGGRPFHDARIRVFVCTIHITCIPHPTPGYGSLRLRLLAAPPATIGLILHRISGA